MMDLQSLRTNILDLPQDKSLALLGAIRQSRLIYKPRAKKKSSPRPSTVPKISKRTLAREQKIKEAVESLSKEQILELMKRIKTGA